jgi:uncharacterized protein (TIGR02285 family)
MLLLIPTAFAKEQAEIYWLTDDVYDAEKLFRPTSEKLSVGDDTVRLLMAGLPQYSFKHKFAHSPSIDRLLNRIPNSCAPNRLKTPDRLEKYLYSLPVNLYLDLHLYYKKNDIVPTILPSMLNKQGQLINLSSLFKHNHDFLLGVDEGRSFGLLLDTQIENLDEHNLVIRGGGRRSVSIAKMLFRDRINYVIDYPTSIKETLNAFPNDIKLASLEIAGMPDYITGHIACSNNEFGKKVIADINKVLSKLYKTTDFYQAHSNYIDQSNLAEFEKAYEKEFTSIVLSSKTHH